MDRLVSQMESEAAKIFLAGRRADHRAPCLSMAEMPSGRCRASSRCARRRPRLDARAAVPSSSRLAAAASRSRRRPKLRPMLPPAPRSMPSSACGPTPTPRSDSPSTRAAFDPLRLHGQPGRAQGRDALPAQSQHRRGSFDTRFNYFTIQGRCAGRHGHLHARAAGRARRPTSRRRCTACSPGDADRARQVGGDVSDPIPQARF